MSITAQVTSETLCSEVERVLAEFPESGIIMTRTTDAHAGEKQIVEIHANEAETLLKFYEKCVEQGIGIDIHRLCYN